MVTNQQIANPELCIIGGGPAGLSAAIRAKEAGLNEVWVIERAPFLGGILNQCIHHGFGLFVFGEELTGPEYAQRLIDRANELAVRFILNTMVTNITPDRTVTYTSEAGLEMVRPKTIILATGCREKPRGSIGIPGNRCAGVLTAGTAQTLVNMKGVKIGKKVAILGSGDIGLIMARRMTISGAEVVGVYEIMPHSSGLKRNIAQCLHDFDIPLYLSHTVTRTVGFDRLHGICVSPVNEKREPILSEEFFVECDTLLLSVGLLPENELAKGMGLRLSPITGGAVVNSRLETSLPGVFSAGNTLHVHDLVDNVTLEAYEAADNAVGYIVDGKQSETVIPVKAGQGVRYTVPMSLVYAEKSEYTLSFRCTEILKNARITIFADNYEVKNVKKRIIIPAEMERMKFTLDSPCAELRVEVKGD